MKKQIVNEKKLSLKKLQLMKVNNMRVINGGGGGMAFSIEDNEVEPTPPIVKDPPIKR
ncbi:hypothetical protein HNP36_003693 [Chryseobacterium shigense]|uniref:Uncharacterized protein n=1 Tax=Chryseobacterium shigense TaxID=297244 RepID=A0A841NPC1_9FLAO|nr:hypothetical protein [Chryseobacterium shigense]